MSAISLHFNILNRTFSTNIGDLTLIGIAAVKKVTGNYLVSHERVKFNNGISTSTIAVNNDDIMIGSAQLGP